MIHLDKGVGRSALLFESYRPIGIGHGLARVADAPVGTRTVATPAFRLAGCSEGASCTAAGPRAREHGAELTAAAAPARSSAAGGAASRASLVRRATGCAEPVFRCLPRAAAALTSLRPQYHPS